MSYEAEGKGTLKINKNSFELLLTWIAKKYKEDKSDNVNEAFSKRGFGIEFDGNGNIKYANYPEGGVRLATDFLNVIEPFIEEGTKLLFVAEDGESFGWPEKTEAEMEGTIESAMFTGNFNMDDFGKIREGILNRLREKGIESDLSEDADIPDFFVWLGMPVPEIDDDYFYWEDADIDLGTLKISYIDFLRVVGKYDIEGSLGAVYDDEGHKSVSYNHNRLEFMNDY